VLCAAIVGSDLVFSARTGRTSENAVQLLQATLDGLGGCGGHAHRAGGKVLNIVQGIESVEDLHEELRRRWLTACAVDRQRGTRLVARRDIVENL
jgi:nanoRNase/pAp phosphatase (c-di-AMP/oligoRNAs hydrolase)